MADECAWKIAVGRHARQAAIWANLRKNSPKVEAYRCDSCGYWHIRKKAVQ